MTADNLFWRNRIVDTGAADPQELAKGYNPDNWRHHPQIQRDALEDALDSIGVLQPVLFNRLSGKVIDGHLRIELAILKGQPLIPVNYVELTDDEEALALATLDAITEQAEPIPDKLAALLARTRQMTADRPGLGAMLDKLRERAGINGNGHEAKDTPPQIDKAAELQKVWGTEVGQIWQLGNHRLAVGDCTDRATVEAVMRGEQVALLFSDPPYGVKRDEGFEGFEGFGGFGPPIARRQYRDDWDSERPTRETFTMHLAASNHALIFGGNYFADILPKSTHWLVWDKLNTMPTFGDCELIWTNLERKSVKKITFEYNGLIGKEKERFHPTQKPVGLCVEILGEYTQDGKAILDPFLGSGTTLIACEQLNRRCRAIEIDPGYAAVSLQRWADLTGQQPKQVA